MSDPGTTEAKTVPLADFEKEQEKRRKYESENEDFKRQLKEIGLSAIEIKALKQAHDDLMKDKATKGGDGKSFDEEISRREAAIRKEIQKTLDEKEVALTTAQGRIKELEVVDKVFQVASPKFNVDVHDDVKGYIRRYGDRDAEGNTIFKDDAGKPRYAPGSTTQLMSTEQFVEHLTSIKPSWASATLKAGSGDQGTKGASGNAANYSPDAFRTMTSEQADKAIADGGELAARAFLSTVRI